MTASTHEAVAAVALAAHYSIFGVDAVFTPKGGSAADVTVIVESRNASTTEGRGHRSGLQSLSCRVRRSELSAIARGDKIAIEGETGTFVVTPTSNDGDGNEWTFDASLETPTQFGDPSIFPDR